MERPSDRELSKKLRLTKAAFASGKFSFIQPDVIAADLLEIDVTMERFQNIFPQALDEIMPRHYKGERPPQRSYENEIFNQELFAFRWDSKAFVCMMYFKFALRPDHLWIVSLHKDRG